MAGSDFGHERKNSLSVMGWRKLIDDCTIFDSSDLGHGSYDISVSCHNSARRLSASVGANKHKNFANHSSTSRGADLCS